MYNISFRRLLALFKNGELAGKPVELIARFRNEEIAFLDLLARGSGVTQFSVVQVSLHILAFFFGVPPVHFSGLAANWCSISMNQDFTVFLFRFQ